MILLAIDICSIELEETFKFAQITIENKYEVTKRMKFFVPLQYAKNKKNIQRVTKITQSKL